MLSGGTSSLAQLHLHCFRNQTSTRTLTLLFIFFLSVAHRYQFISLPLHSFPTGCPMTPVLARGKCLVVERSQWLEVSSDIKW